MPPTLISILPGCAYMHPDKMYSQSQADDILRSIAYEVGGAPSPLAAYFEQDSFHSIDGRFGCTGHSMKSEKVILHLRVLDGGAVVGQRIFADECGRRDNVAVNGAIKANRLWLKYAWPNGAVIDHFEIHRNGNQLIHDVRSYADGSVRMPRSGEDYQYSSYSFFSGDYYVAKNPPTDANALTAEMDWIAARSGENAAAEQRRDRELGQSFYQALQEQAGAAELRAQASQRELKDTIARAASPDQHNRLKNLQPSSDGKKPESQTKAYFSFKDVEHKEAQPYNAVNTPSATLKFIIMKSVGAQNKTNGSCYSNIISTQGPKGRLDKWDGEKRVRPFIQAFYKSFVDKCAKKDNDKNSQPPYIYAKDSKGEAEINATYTRLSESKENILVTLP